MQVNALILSKYTVMYLGAKEHHICELLSK
jgi:hypothetical protein